MEDDQILNAESSDYSSHSPDDPTASAQSKHSSDPSKDTHKPPPVNFSLFLSTLAMKAYIALGEIGDPSKGPQTGEHTINLPQAKYMIDMISLIQTKTIGNLEDEEEAMLQKLLSDLLIKYEEKLSS